MASIGELSGKITLDASQAMNALNGIAGLLGAGLGIAGIGLTLAGLKNLGETAEKAGDFAEGMSRNFGDVTKTMATLRGAVQGAVSDMDLMKGANEMAVKGITNNADKIGGIWQTAQVRAKELGTTTVEEFDKLEAAILRPAMLKRLYSDVPEALTKTANGMGTTATRAEALSYVLNKGALAVDQYTKAGLAIADPWEQFDATMNNVKQTLSMAIAPLLVDVANLIAMVARAISVFVEKNRGAIEGILKFGQAVVVVIADILGLTSTLQDTNSATNGLDSSFNNLFTGASDGAQNAAENTDALAQSVKDLQRQIEDENYSFNKSLNDIIQKREDAIKKNKEQLAQQQSQFDKSNADNKKAETQKTADMKKALDQRIADLQTNMANTLVVGSKTYDADLARYLEIIAKEKEEGEKKIAEQEQLFQDQTDAAQKQFDDQTSALKQSIKDDEDFLKKHADDVKLINQGMILDEIDELKRGHEQKLKDLQEANAKQLDSMKGLSTDWQKVIDKMPKLNFNSLLTWPDTKTAFNTIKTDLVTAFYDIGKVLASGLIAVIIAFDKAFWNTLGDAGARLLTGKSLKEVQQQLSIDEMIMLNGITKSADNNKLRTLKDMGIGQNAVGTNNWKGGWSMVGENGPELVNLPRGSQVIPNNEISNYSNRQVTINNFIDKGFDVDAFNNRLNFQLRTL